MKGLAVLALGAILIWFGLSRNADAPEDTVHAADPSRVEEDRSDSSDSTDSRMVLQQRRDPSGRAEAREPRGDSRSAPPEEPAVRDAAEQDRSIAQEVVAPQDPVRATENQADPVAASPPDRRTGFAGGSQGEPLRQADDGRAGLMFSAGPDPERVATFLLNSWIAGDEGDLETFLKQGEGADLPDAKRQLVASFWQAISGYPDQAKEGLDRIRGAEGITTAQESLLSAALDLPGSRAVPRAASSGRPEPLAYAMRMMLLGDEAEELLRKREYGASAVAWSDLIQSEIHAPWAPNQKALVQWGEGLDRAQANHRFNVNGSWPSIEEKVQNGDSLTVLRKRVLQRRNDIVICTGLISQVNGVRGYVHPGDVMRIPTDRVNVIVDLEARVLLYRHGDEVVKLWAVGIGKPGNETPIGVYEIGHKIEKPAHTTNGLPYGDPDNELGSRWMGLRRPGQSSDTSYGIHGTTFPDSVGGAVSLGCVRMRNEQVDELFEILPRGAEVVIQQ
ncbi:L,D-transpeptidase family protein [Planctomycetes bacterium Poly30]|uniref:L,D-transpeptidase n=1 Tax=Saltatorellus ferox TaxID=2528018 RepID=UPI0011A4FD1C